MSIDIENDLKLTPLKAWVKEDDENKDDFVAYFCVIFLDRYAYEGRFEKSLDVFGLTASF